MLERDLIVFNACNSLAEIVHLNDDLKSFNLALTTVLVPSKERISKRISEAREIARLHGRWIGSSEEEVEKNFKEFKAVLQEIKEGLKNTAIEVIEC